MPVGKRECVRESENEVSALCFAKHYYSPSPPVGVCIIVGSRQLQPVADRSEFAENDPERNKNIERVDKGIVICKSKFLFMMVMLTINKK